MKMKKLLFTLTITFIALNTGASTRGDILRGIDNDKVSKFINSVWDDAQTVAHEYNIPMGLLIAQSALESGWGKSSICKTKNNFLGIRYNHEYATFESRLECFRAYGRVLSQNCYKEIPMSSLNVCLYLLESCHYHQSENYSNKIRSIYYKYNLSKCDKWGK